MKKFLKQILFWAVLVALMCAIVVSIVNYLEHAKHTGPLPAPIFTP